MSIDKQTVKKKKKKKKEATTKKDRDKETQKGTGEKRIKSRYNAYIYIYIWYLLRICRFEECSIVPHERARECVTTATLQPREKSEVCTLLLRFPRDDDSQYCCAEGKHWRCIEHAWMHPHRSHQCYRPCRPYPCLCPPGVVAWRDPHPSIQIPAGPKRWSRERCERMTRKDGKTDVSTYRICNTVR